ncbi:unnamed protein product [Clonostachys rosea]|uniref:Aminoglycoside phosphotransferase domain-containing protein n=1 Tax=Bionectria ochroleuca TaxID=29856 RepID=A0ABY6U5L5_BIOOC|nr:unnamed protein product [Clonostachys rosea]
MGKPSENWLGFAGMSPGSDKYQRIKLIISSADFNYLKLRAIESRREHDPNSPQQLDCGVNLIHFTSGFDNLVLELAFSDGICWVARIPHRPLEDAHKTSMLSEIATMRLISNHTTIPIPRIFGFNVSTGQSFGYPYIFMEYLDGQSLPSGIATSIPSEFHPKVAKQLANVFGQLQNLTFSRIGRIICGEEADQRPEIIPMTWHATPGPLETSFEYFYNQRQAENREALQMHPGDPDWRTACWVLKSALLRSIVEDRVRGPFPLCHLDLHYGNMLFDTEYNLVGLIDWSSAQAAPLEQLSVCPELIPFPGRTEEENKPILELRRLVIESIKEIEAQQVLKAPLDNPDIDLGNMKDQTRVSTYMASASAEITHRQYMASPRAILWVGKRVAKLMYGDAITWEQLREVYGTMDL